MYTKSLFAFITAALFAGQVIASPMIAPNADSACQCPNNCQHHDGDSCKYYSEGNVLQGTCAPISSTDDALTCKV